LNTCPFGHSTRIPMVGRAPSPHHSEIHRLPAAGARSFGGQTTRPAQAVLPFAARRADSRRPSVARRCASTRCAAAADAARSSSQNSGGVHPRGRHVPPPSPAAAGCLGAFLRATTNQIARGPRRPKPCVDECDGKSNDFKEETSALRAQRGLAARLTLLLRPLRFPCPQSITTPASRQ
jgi:hypothetical protein